VSPSRTLDLACALGRQPYVAGEAVMTALRSESACAAVSMSVINVLREK
jgi:hypothetical protein